MNLYRVMTHMRYIITHNDVSLDITRTVFLLLVTRGDVGRFVSWFQILNGNECFCNFWIIVFSFSHTQKETNNLAWTGNCEWKLA